MTLIFFLAIGYLLYQYLKEKFEPKIPKGYWRNEYLLNQDRVEHLMSPKQILENVEKGKYYLTDEEYEEMNKPYDYSCHKGKYGLELNESIQKQHEDRKKKFLNINRRMK